MLVREGEERGNDVDVRLACTLAAVAGALNAAAFHAVGFFSANMTGNVSSLSVHLARGDLLLGAFFFAIVAAFVGGSAISTLLVNAGRRRRISSIYAFSVLAEAVLLAALGCADLLLPATGRGLLLVLGLSFLMGLQNAVVTRISNARVRTTHVSGMATDIGIEIAMLIDIARRREPLEEAAAYRSKLNLHGVTILSFLAGGVAGVLLYQRVGGALLLGVAVALLGIGFSGLLGARRMEALRHRQQTSR